jgi:glycosyltransferase involved in cell wall biosynthesis
VCGLGVPEKNVLFYPNCVDTSVFDPSLYSDEARRNTRAKLGVPSDADLFSFVGTFGQWHGTDVLASVIRRLIDDEPDFLRGNRIHFLFVGDGQYAAKVRSILGESLGMPYVTLSGFRPQEETPAILAASDVLLSPHIPNPDGTPFFGSPTKLFEYMAMAKPIIGSDLDQIGWVLRGLTPVTLGTELSNSTDAVALLVRPGDPLSLASAIRRAVGMTDEQRKDMGERARELVRRAYTWDQNVNAVMNRLEDLIKS